MKNKKLMIIILSALAGAILLASLGTLYFKNREIKGLEAENTVLLQSANMLNEDIDALEGSLSDIETKLTELNDDFDKLNSELSDAKDENERLYKLIEDADTDTNIEDYFEKVVYLTFDDGPSYLTSRVLDILDNNNIKGTFFVLHTDYGERHDLYNEIVDRGHAIGNHTYSHVYSYSYSSMGWDVFWDDFFKMEDFIYEQTGVRPKIMRFPGGSTNAWNEDEVAIAEIEKLHDMGYEFFDWNATVGDGSGQPTTQEVYDSVVNRTYGGRLNKVVILMHDRRGNEASIDALPAIINFLKESGYTFLPMTEDSFAPHIFGTERMDTEVLN